MILRPIKTEDDYNEALKRVSDLMEADPDDGTPEGDELDILLVLVEKYEDVHWAIAEPDPIEAIKVRMEQMGIGRKELEPMIGGKGKVSEVLSRKIPLSLGMIVKLAAGLSLPMDLLIKGSSWYVKNKEALHPVR